MTRQVDWPAIESKYFWIIFSVLFLLLRLEQKILFFKVDG
jgi:hypothetical protein